jgi:glycine cleavage system transcriptional repressor
MAETDRLLMMAVGPDQVGLVRRISEYIAHGGGNIEDSRMAVLAGEFALIILISGERHKLSAIAQSASELGEQTGLAIWVKQPSGKKPPEAAIPYLLVASCMDHPGVVKRVSSVLSNHSINIESMETQTYAAPVSGTPIFRMEASISIPAGVNINAVRQALDQIAREENIDIDLSLM